MFGNPLGGGGLSFASSSSAGPATSGNLGIQIQGITTGGASNSGNNSMLLYAVLALVAVMVLRR